ncbi:hypothetical protein ACFLZB_02530 [Nanoarchaeota archaeon]
MTNKQRNIIFLGKNHSHAYAVEHCTSDVNRHIVVRDQEYQFRYARSLRALNHIAKNLNPEISDISLIVLDSIYSIMATPFAKDEEQEERMCMNDIGYCFKILDKWLPNTPVALYPLDFVRIKKRPTNFENELVKMNLFLGTSNQEYFKWMGEGYQPPTVWSSKPLAALARAQNQAIKDGSPMTVLLYEDAPLLKFSEPILSHEVGIGTMFSYRLEQGNFPVGEVHLETFSEIRRGRDEAQSLVSLLRNHSGNFFDRAYLSEAFKQVREARKESRKLAQSYRLFQKATQPKRPKTTPEDFEKILERAQISRIPNSQSGKTRIDSQNPTS